MLPDLQSQPGNVVVWDNRRTIHAATGFDYAHYTREKWRLMLLDGAQGEIVNQRP